MEKSGVSSLQQWVTEQEDQIESGLAGTERLLYFI
jgi:hypothetical protein